MIGSLIIDAIKSKIFGSKDYFERVKKSLIRSLIAPLFIVVGTPTAFLAVLANVQYLEFTAYGAVIKFLGASSSEFLFLAGSVILTFLSALACNLYYSFHNARITKELKELENLEQRKLAFNKYVDQYNKYIESNQNEKASQLGNFLVRRFQPETEKNPEFIISLLENSNGNPLLLEAVPEAQLSLTNRFGHEHEQNPSA